MKTKFNTAILTVLLGSSLVFASCKNETEMVSQLAKPSAAGFNDIRKNALADLTITKEFKAEEGLDFTTGKGTQIKISPNCLRDNSNNLVAGNVSLSFVEMYDRGNMLLTNKALMGKNSNGDYLPLVTGGQFNIEVFKGTQKLKSGCTFYVNIPASLTGGIDDEMKLWFGQTDENGDLKWEENQMEGAQGKRAGMNANMEYSTYNIWSNEFGWTNVDRFSAEPDPSTQIKVTVPSAYNQTNSAVYLSYENERNLLAQLDVYDVQENYFSEHYGFVPIGKTVHVIFTTESNGSIVYGIKKVTIVANGVINFAESDLNITSKSNLVSIINNLN